MDYDNNDRGALFKQDKTNDKAPDYKGSFNFKGSDFKIAGWVRESKAGKKYLSLSVDDFVPEQKAESKVESKGVVDVPF